MKTKSFWTWPDYQWSSVHVHRHSTVQSWLILVWVFVVLNNPVELGKWAGTVVKSFKLATIF